MTLVTTALPNLVGGVSQQPDTIRYPNQSEEQVNAAPSVSDGLMKRPPTEHLTVLQDSEGDDVIPSNAGNYKPHVHTINRDVNERYIVSVVQELNSHGYSDDKYRPVIRVNDINGVAQEVRWHVPQHADGTDDLEGLEYFHSYLAPLAFDASGDVYETPPNLTISPGADEPDIEFQTIGDVTLMLNKSVKPLKHWKIQTSDQGPAFFEGLQTAGVGGGPRLQPRTMGFFRVKRSDFNASFKLTLTAREIDPTTGHEDWFAKFGITNRDNTTLIISLPGGDFTTHETSFGAMNTANIALMLCRMINGTWTNIDGNTFSADASHLANVDHVSALEHYDNLAKWIKFSGVSKNVTGGHRSQAWQTMTDNRPGLIAYAIGSTVFIYRNQSWVNQQGTYDPPIDNPFFGARGTHVYPDNRFLEFDISVSDSFGDEGVVAGVDSVGKFSDLPPFGFAAHDGLGVTEGDQDPPVKFGDLNYHGGWRVRVTGESADSSDDYWVEFVPESVKNHIRGYKYGVDYTDPFFPLNDEIATGHDWNTFLDEESGFWNNEDINAPEFIFNGRWREGVGDGANFGIWDRYGMPLLLIRQSDGSFLVKAADGTSPKAVAEGGQRPDGDAEDVYNKYRWRPRACGDDEMNEDPTFVGETINGMTFYNNRLVFLSGENVVMSEAGDIFNFYRKSMRSLRDSDPIDVATTHDRVSVLRSARGYGDRMLLMSDQTQFMCYGDPILSPDLVTLAPVSTFESIKDCSPIVSGGSIFFPFKRGGFSGLREWFATGTAANSYDSTDVTAHIPAYIPGDISKISAADHENIIVALSDTNRDEIYAYYFYGEGQQRHQSAWGKWTFGGDAIIHEIEVIDAVLYVVVERREDDGANPRLHLEKINLQSGVVDDGSTYFTSLDRRIDNGTTGVSATYSSATNRTTITTPYKIQHGVTMQVVSKGGEIANMVSHAAEGVSVIIEGDWSSTSPDTDRRTWWLGEKYDMEYTFTKPLFKVSQAGTGKAFVAQGRHQLRYGTIVYSDTSDFDVTVTPSPGTAETYSYTGKILGTDDGILGTTKLSDGEFRFPIFAQSDSVTMKLINDSPIPAHFDSAEFEANYTTRSRRRG